MTCFVGFRGNVGKASKALFIFICFSLFSSLLWLFIQPQLLEMDMFGGRSPLSHQQLYQLFSFTGCQ